MVTLKEKGAGVLGFRVIKDMTPYVAQFKAELLQYFRFAAS